MNEARGTDSIAARRPESCKPAARARSTNAAKPSRPESTFQCSTQPIHNVMSSQIQLQGRHGNLPVLQGRDVRSSTGPELWRPKRSQ